MSKLKAFKSCHYESDITLWCVQWYTQLTLTYRQIKGMFAKRSLPIFHTTIMRWFHYFWLEINQKVKPFLCKVNNFWRCNETFMEISETWKYFYRALDSAKNTMSFFLSAKRVKKADFHFLKKMLDNDYVKQPCIISDCKHTYYISALELIRSNDKLEKIYLRQVHYIDSNNSKADSFCSIQSKIRAVVSGSFILYNHL